MTAIEHKQLWQAVADKIRDEILEGRLPAGSRLVELDLAERFGVSRGPVRDALAELAREGLAEDIPRRGTFVSSLTETDLAEVYVIRRALEEAAVRLAVEHAADDADAIAEMYIALEATETAYAAGNLTAAWDADMAFHRSYCRMSHNGRLLTLFDELSSQTVLLMRTALAKKASLRWSPPVEVHREIADAIRDGKVDVAVEAIGRHFQYTQDRLQASDEA